MPDFCPRCFWIKLRLGNKLPFQIFPGIFSSIDSYTKSVVHGFVDQHGAFPSWLNELGDLKAYKQPPPSSRFHVHDRKNDIVLTGVPDGVGPSLRSFTRSISTTAAMCGRRRRESRPSSGGGLAAACPTPSSRRKASRSSRDYTRRSRKNAELPLDVGEIAGRTKIACQLSSPCQRGR